MRDGAADLDDLGVFPRRVWAIPGRGSVHLIRSGGAGWPERPQPGGHAETRKAVSDAWEADTILGFGRVRKAGHSAQKRATRRDPPVLGHGDAGTRTGASPMEPDLPGPSVDEAILLAIIGYRATHQHGGMERSE